MAERYQSYPEYKSSGVRFFNDIPQHWEISKVRFISSFGRGLGITKANLKDVGVPCVSYGEVHSKYGFEVDPTKHDLKCVDETYLRTAPDSLLSKGDFVFADTSEDIDGSGNFTQLVSHETLFAGYHTVVVRPTTENYYRFLAYVFDSPEYRTQIRDAVKGVKVFSVTQAILKNTNVWLPTYEEQQKIANFLDHETAKVDTLIAKQEKLIELLKEKRQAVISHAVTRGLNPDAPMKDSGVEWLGEVPEHWEVKKLKYIINTLESGVSVNSESTPASGQEFGVLKTSCVYTREFRVEENKKVVLEEYDRVKCPVRKNSLIISRMNTPELVGAAAFSDRDHNNLFLPDRLWQTIFFDDKRQNPKFISYFMTTKFYRDAIAMAATGTSSSMQNIAKEDLLNIELPFPSRKEQNLICEELSSKLQKIDLLMSKSNGAINLIKERKIALISAAVTGKIDVRNYNAEKAGS